MNPYEPYRAPSNSETCGVTCHFCGQTIQSGQIVADIKLGQSRFVPDMDEMATAHDSCLLDELHPEAAA